MIRPVSEFHKGTRLKIIWPVDVKLIQWILIFRNGVCDYLFHIQFDHLITLYHSCTLHHCDWCHNLPSPRQLRQSNTKGDKCAIDHLRIHLPLQCFHLLFTFFWSRWFVHHPNFTPNAAFFKGANLHWKRIIRNQPWGTFWDNICKKPQTWSPVRKYPTWQSAPRSAEWGRRRWGAVSSSRSPHTCVHHHHHQCR